MLIDAECDFELINNENKKAEDYMSRELFKETIMKHTINKLNVDEQEDAADTQAQRHDVRVTHRRGRSEICQIFQGVFDCEHLDGEMSGINYRVNLALQFAA